MARRTRAAEPVRPCSNVASPVKVRTATSSLAARMTVSTKRCAADFSSGSVRSCEAEQSMRMASESGRSVSRWKVKTFCSTPSSSTRMSSCLSEVTKRLLLSTAVKSTFVRSVSTRSTSSSSIVSSRCGAGRCGGGCCCRPTCCALTPAPGGNKTDAASTSAKTAPNLLWLNISSLSDK
jgi:hypothetical protein